jgi:hypothetical protein
MNLTAEGRTTVRRIAADPNESREVSFYCDHCGAANVITLTREMIEAFIGRLSSDDPQIQQAINDAKRGDYRSAIDEARKRFGF